MMFKRLFIFVLMVCFFIIITSCSPNNGNQTETDNRLNSIISNKEMRVGYLVFDPCVIKNQQTGELSGIYVDMVNEMANSLKVKVTWVETNLANFSTGLNSNQFDFSVGPTFVTIPRSTSVAFSNAINYVGNSGIVAKNSKLKPTSIQELNRKEVKIAVLQGQAMEEFCKRNIPNAELVSFSGSDLTAPLTAVSSGKADIGFMNNVTVLKYAKEHPETEAVFVDNNQLEVLPLSWTTRFEDKSLMSFLNSSITYLKSTKRLDEYQKKYEIQLLYESNQVEKIK